jgi:hypothetical protein
LTHPQLKNQRYLFFIGVATPSQHNFQATQETTKNTIFMMKVIRGTRAAEYVQRIDLSPVQTTLKLNEPLVMGKLTGEDLINSLGNSVMGLIVFPQANRAIK